MSGGRHECSNCTHWRTDMADGAGRFIGERGDCNALRKATDSDDWCRKYGRAGWFAREEEGGAS